MPKTCKGSSTPPHTHHDITVAKPFQRSGLSCASLQVIGLPSMTMATAVPLPD